MTVGTDADREFAGKRNDPRITRVGRLLRLSRIDEIPQMYNVLKGDMSFIGPRALIESEVTEFSDRIPYFSLRHSVRPGITGWAQVKYKHGARVEDGLEKLQYDLFYIKNLSPLLDFHILMKTIRVVLLGKGAR
jgi:lipopolysaccharide/colanic/teichoic acid biosynthesis glycosyltransferase